MNISISKSKTILTSSTLLKTIGKNKKINTSHFSNKFSRVYIDRQANLLVFDCGGGTFDVVILVAKDGELEVRAGNGDTFLGGSNLDECLVDHFKETFQRKNKLDVTESPKALAKLKKQAEETKRPHYS